SEVEQRILTTFRECEAGVDRPRPPAFEGDDVTKVEVLVPHYPPDQAGAERIGHLRLGRRGREIKIPQREQRTHVKTFTKGRFLHLRSHVRIGNLPDQFHRPLAPQHLGLVRWAQTPEQATIDLVDQRFSLRVLVIARRLYQYFSARARIRVLEERSGRDPKIFRSGVHELARGGEWCVELFAQGITLPGQSA